jgi:glycosyltransferase involved in cell wall biosynthesis
MFENKIAEEDLKSVIVRGLEIPFELYEKQPFEGRYTALKNALLYVRNMEVKTDEDAAFRVKAVDFADKLLLSLANDPMPLSTTGRYKQIYTLSPMIPFNNQNLLKEKSLNGYFLSKMTGGEHHMAFADLKTDYGFLKYVSDTDLLYLSSEQFTAETYREFIIQNAHQMDILILPFPCNASAYFESLYRDNRKDGKVIITTDTNRQYMNNHFSMAPELIQPFFEGADVVTIPSHDLRDRMNGNKENQFPVFTLRHSFANATGEDLDTSPSDKENIILTVGNLNSLYKNVYLLIEAFSKAAELIPDWKLVLAGSFSEDLIRGILKKYANIKNRLIFTGELDKPELYDLYRRAKIFCMPTLCDDLPLVCSEAMAFGCYQILSDSMDGADDLTRNGEYGVVYEQEKYIVHPEPFKYQYIEGYNGEAEQNLANALVEAAHKLDYNFMKSFIPKSKKLQRTEFDYDVNARILGLLLFT